MITIGEYIRLAETIKQEFPVPNHNINANGSVRYAEIPRWMAGAYDEWSTMTLNIGKTLAIANPRFDVEKFYHACGYYAEDRIRA